MDWKEIKELEDKIDEKVNTILTEVQRLEWLINQQTDMSQRHADQALIHSLVTVLFDLETNRDKLNLIQ